MDYKYESYLFDICYFCNQITGKNYTYSRSKNHAIIAWFEGGKKETFSFDVQFFYGPMNLSAKDVAEMVVKK